MKYKAFLKQEGEGCDYTIGCGMILIDLEASSMGEAVGKLIDEIEENYTNDENRLEIAQVYEVSRTTDIALKEFYATFEKEKENRKKAEKERIQYERLKQKFG